MTLNDFANIFYSNYRPNADWQELTEILWMYENGLFTLDKTRVSFHGEFINAIGQIEQNKHKIVPEYTDGISHQALKLLGGRSLFRHFKLGSELIRYEYPFIGFKVDIIDTGLKFPVECGDTNAIKLEHYLLHSTVKSMAIIPYPRSTDVYAYMFTSKPTFNDSIHHKRLSTFRSIGKK